MPRGIQEWSPIARLSEAASREIQSALLIFPIPQAQNAEECSKTWRILDFQGRDCIKQHNQKSDLLQYIPLTLKQVGVLVSRDRSRPDLTPLQAIKALGDSLVMPGRTSPRASVPK
jgi:hypothetical protein